jgi:hypothetical protein
VMSSFGECAPTRYTGMTAVAVIIHSWIYKFLNVYM